MNIHSIPNIIISTIYAETGIQKSFGMLLSNLILKRRKMPNILSTSIAYRYRIYICMYILIPYIPLLLCIIALEPVNAARGLCKYQLVESFSHINSLLPPPTGIMSPDRFGNFYYLTVMS